ncbi:MAG TPA: hypothetical protein VG963_01470, partial [Polyangiaceae bacterium]|nr:hypothetical protein [Polyangiaceae bacterium]
MSWVRNSSRRGESYVGCGRARRRAWRGGPSWRRAWCWGALAWGAPCLLACPKLGQDTGSSSSDSSSSGGSSGSSASASSKRLDQLSTAELSDECKSINDELNTRFSNRRLATYDCTRLYLQSGDATACSQAVNDCVNASPDASPTAARPADFTIDGIECTALQDCPV